MYMCMCACVCARGACGGWCGAGGVRVSSIGPIHHVVSGICGVGKVFAASRGYNVAAGSPQRATSTHQPV